MPSDKQMPLAEVRNLLRNARDVHAEVQLNMRVRRMLINRDVAPATSNLTGTSLPAPFNKTSLAIRTMVGEPAKAAQHYASRIAANRPDVSVIPTTTRTEVTATLDKRAGEQERVDNVMWTENGGRDAQWSIGWAMSVGGVGYYLTLPRDAGFGLPDRVYYEDKTDDEIEIMKREGYLSPAKRTSPKTGQLVYAEAGDVWAARRKESARNRATSGRSLFTVEAFPRDMVLRERDIDGMKWAAIVEEIPGTALAPGGELAMSAARRDGVPMDDQSLYGLFRDDKGAIIGGVARGGPIGSQRNTNGTFTLIRFFNRVEQIVLVASVGSIDGAREVYRGKHGAMDGGVPVCPVIEVPFMRTDVYSPGGEFSTPLSQVFALVPLINQIETLRSNAEVFNLIPRWVVEMKDGSILRGEDGEPTIITAEQTPGLDPQQATAYPGTLKQLVIDTAQSDELLSLYLNQLAAAMPAPVTSGESGTSAAAYQVRQLIQQAQEVLRQPVDNHAMAVKQIIRMWHGWLRSLDTPIYFFSAPGHRSSKRAMRGLVEFNPRDFTDSIEVTQSLDTPAEMTVLLQQGLELLKARVINYEEFFEDYARSQDARQKVIDLYVQMGVDYLMTGALPTAAGPIDPTAMPLIKQIADGVRGQIHYNMLRSSANYAIAQAEQIVAQAQQPQPGAPVGGGNVAAAAGIRQPGMGMAGTIEGVLGNNLPGGQPSPQPVTV